MELTMFRETYIDTTFGELTMKILVDTVQINDFMFLLDFLHQKFSIVDVVIDKDIYLNFFIRKIEDV